MTHVLSLSAWQRDVVLAKEGEDTDLAKATHDARLTLWAFNNNEKRNVRTLLSTMHVRRYCIHDHSYDVSLISYIL